MTYAPDHALIATPIGMVRIEGDHDRMSRIRIEGPIGDAQRSSNMRAVREAVSQLRAYFTGDRRAFDLPLIALQSPRGEALRTAIASVGYGETLSYGALARIIASGPRAVGQACARNPYPIVVPCHRILASAGRLGAYSAGEGPATKQWLLDHETRHAEKDSKWAA